jgi:hypothetical protein
MPTGGDPDMTGTGEYDIRVVTLIDDVRKMILARQTQAVLSKNK